MIMLLQGAKTTQTSPKRKRSKPAVVESPQEIAKANKVHPRVLDSQGNYDPVAIFETFLNMFNEKFNDTGETRRGVDEESDDDTNG